MSKLLDQFYEDRELRDAARAVLVADIEHARTSFSKEGITDRLGSRVSDGAKDVFDVAKGHADDNRGVIALLIGALFLWLAREPISEILGLDEDGSEPAMEPAQPPDLKVEDLPSDKDPAPIEAEPALDIEPGDDNEQ